MQHSSSLSENSLHHPRPNQTLKPNPASYQSDLSNSRQSQDQEIHQQSLQQTEGKEQNLAKDQQLSNRDKIRQLQERIKNLDTFGGTPLIQNKKNSLQRKPAVKQESGVRLLKSLSPKNSSGYSENSRFSFLSPKASETRDKNKFISRKEEQKSRKIQNPFNQPVFHSEEEVDKQSFESGQLDHQSMEDGLYNRHEYPSRPGTKLYQKPSTLLNNNGIFYPLEYKYLAIEDKFMKFQISEENLFRNIEDQISELSKNQKTFKKRQEKAFNNDQQALENTQRLVIEEINELYEELKQLKKGAIESIDSKYKAIKTQTMAMIGEDFQLQCKNSMHELSSQIQKINEKASKSQRIRDQTAEFLISSFSDQVARLEQVLNQEKEERIVKNDQFLRLIQQVEERLSESVKNEKKQMIDSIENMENMLEEVCYKIEQKVLGENNY